MNNLLDKNKKIRVSYLLIFLDAADLWCAVSSWSDSNLAGQHLTFFPLQASSQVWQDWPGRLSASGCVWSVDRVRWPIPTNPLVPDDQGQHRRPARTRSFTFFRGPRCWNNRFRRAGWQSEMLFIPFPDSENGGNVSYFDNFLFELMEIKQVPSIFVDSSAYVQRRRPF